MERMPITPAETRELHPRPPALLIDGQLVELPPESAEHRGASAAVLVSSS
jgi:hypothetical protein